MEDITVHTELERLVAAVPWNVGTACKMLLGIDAVQSVRHKLVVSDGQQTFCRVCNYGILYYSICTQCPLLHLFM